ncbi:ABC transporter substrate-binding protein [Gordonia sp. SID5947]|uniref:ABC transporter substrate-binding protein n=1 Tax=Gordonia sp. SID5947 TaxID=2690315 RepID=UPI00136D0061|nr:ABC transporter substrate-binding protein [Gordonia sp. SID5947]MYR07784.1 ABC transporter substrate-binding protein [Gordonia sp. SID5947]
MRRTRFTRRLTTTLATVAIAASTAFVAACGSDAPADAIVVASPQCAHCLSMSLLPDQMPDEDVTYQNFTKLSDLSTGLASGRINVGQIDYTALVSLISKGLPIVAISGQVNGGSDFVVDPGLGLKQGDWAALNSAAKQAKADGHPLKIGSQFGTVQDIELRLELPMKGIDPNNDVEMTNVPYEGMGQALANHSIDAAIPAQPFAAEIIDQKFGQHFAYPYDQAAGDLTNVVVVSKDYIAKQPDKVEAVAQGMSKLIPYLKTPQGQQDWIAAIKQYTNVSDVAINQAMPQLSPSIEMPFEQIKAIADAMYAQKLISQPLTDEQIREHIDYTMLATATGQPSQALGDAR